VRIDPDTGLLASPGQSNAIFEYFLQENVPSRAGGATSPGEGSGGTDDLLRDIF
jgi:penicillin-binding protein 1A